MRLRSVLPLVLLALVLSASSAFAQAAPTDKFGFDIAAASLAQANGYRYDLELDNVLQPSPLVVTCVTPSGTPVQFSCTAPIPAITPTTHTARIRAVDTSGSTPLLGPWSDLLTFTMRATPAKPSGLTIVPGGGSSGDDNAPLVFDLGSIAAPGQ